MIEFLHAHALTLGHLAPWVFFGLIVIAGFNVPISADVVILAAATLAATLLPEKTWIFYFSLLFGCIVSAWCAYFLGKFLGKKLLKIKWFASLFPPHRIEKIRKFYHKHGLLTLIIGRFIPFGMRNALFMSTGMAKCPFAQFALRDSLACFIWCTTLYWFFYKLAQNIEQLKIHLKVFNIVIFALFAIATISFVWYKRYRKKVKPSG